MTREIVTISIAKYERLIKDQKTLNALYAAGVDNWEGYSFAFQDEDLDELDEEDEEYVDSN